MALEGTIKDFGLADILQLIGLQRKTGVLTLEGSANTVTVKFLEGAVVGADTSDRNLEDLLGSVLVRTGRITDAQLQESLRIQRSTLQRLGYILVKQDFISGDDLEEALRIQVSQIVYRLFRWRAGKYQFAPMDHMEYDNEHFRPLSAETILMEGARMIDEWPILERKIKSPSMVFKQTAAGAELDVPVASLLDADIDFGFGDSAEGAKKKKDAIRISPDERDVLHLVDGRASVQDIIDLSALAEFDIYRSLYELANRNLIEEVTLSVAVGLAPAAATRNVWVSFVLQTVVISAAVLGVLTLNINSVTPWRLVDGSRETEVLKTYASKNRLERLEHAVQVYYLDHGSIPESLEAVSRAGYVRPAELKDPWGRRYAFMADGSGYQISGQARGRETDDLVVRHAYSTAERMVLEGGAGDRTTHP
jgi:Domain of unknown function (DUF4388)/Type II secretion system (T2SS), protein G